MTGAVTPRGVAPGAVAPRGVTPDAVTTTAVQRRALWLIEWYQRAYDGRPSPCRFTPSCSSYAHEAFAVHGTARGFGLTVRRLLRCRPFGPSGFDPVPEKGA